MSGRFHRNKHIKKLKGENTYKMRKNDLLPKRQKKSQEVKKKIIKAALELMNRYGYEYLTIRNICKLANVSNGSFYHYFKSKDGLMSYFIRNGYERYWQENSKRWEELSAQYRVVDIMTWIGIYFCELGVGFVTSYYSCKNQALNVRNPEGAKFHKEIINDLISQLEVAQNEGMISTDFDIMNIYYELNRIFFGVVFDWALCNGCFDLANTINRMLIMQLNNYLFDDYKMYPKP
jgi:AcrR family transcriptional regulator